MKPIHIIIKSLSLFIFIMYASGTSFGEDFFEKNRLNSIKGLQWAQDEIIVKFKRGISEDIIQKINQQHDTSVKAISKRGKFLRLNIPQNKTVEDMLNIYRHNPNVEYVEPNFTVFALMIPNDPYYSYQWNFSNNEYGGIHTESAWDIQTGSVDVIVAVIDTGVAYENYNNFKQAPDLSSTSFVPGYDFFNNDTHPNDDEGHGTHVAGTIAQSTNNHSGVAGIAFDVSIMPIKVLDAKGSGTHSDIANGIYFAADNGAHIINMSLGGSSPSITLENALAYAYNKGVTIICAAGNEFMEGNPPSYPAAYNAYCIAVGATTYNEAKANYSNTGSYIDLVAPGGDLNADLNGDGYGDGILQQTFDTNSKNFGYWFYQGTSMSAPHVSAVSALLITNGTSSPELIREALLSTAKDKGSPGWDEAYGWGLLDAYAALNYTYVKTHDIAVTKIVLPESFYQKDIVDIPVTVTNQGDYEESFNLSLTDVTDSYEIGMIPLVLSAKQTENALFQWDTGSSSIGNHILNAQISVVTGETDIADNTLSTETIIKEEPVWSEIHVSDIAIGLNKKKVLYQGVVHVTVEDASGKPVEGVSVSGEWIFNDTKTLKTVSASTDISGVAILVSKKVNASSSDKFTFSINDIIKDGYTYNPAINTESSDSVTVP